MPQFSLLDANSTRQLGFDLGALLLPGDIITLSGPLGGGKTTFAQGVASALGISEPISSPTFVIINEYAAEIPLLHMDAYRLEGLDYDALREAGLEDFLSRTDAIRLLEWPEMVRPWLPTSRFQLQFEIENQGETATRRVTLHGE
ncbi:tRNA threonylcarbamoyladenosine biosynthesis protein TsaE [Abditibacterium utsteinense]|uniref:tRNA threonylcarbamoyladenosine biosynthesis protein TsaE n=1 Tax=Abditibacterium utsteinense TaxID=1960156 RepID=A0A2S8SVJ4_9BACT|nr:tRNA (adenosine(37)-N6)-threonylcarbamoyltransferase complex ATPase subunit type 1 TsaE [Abditibacterium utsteinense]PQV64811.1 tRNA threonylcarbamoyladenosine biosynthesis protein TsaE [Abditibacterium utsteinense]